MGSQIHTSESHGLAMSVLSGNEIADIHGSRSFIPIEQALVLEDGDNCLTYILVGSDDELEKFAVDILERIKRKPMVLVIENPREDPDIYSHGPVEIDYTSSYPASSWASGEREDYEDYEETHLTSAAEAEAAGAVEIAKANRELAEAFRKAKESD